MGREILRCAQDDRAVLPAAPWPTQAHVPMRLMRIVADKSAVAAINRALRLKRRYYEIKRRDDITSEEMTLTSEEIILRVKRRYYEIKRRDDITRSREETILRDQERDGLFASVERSRCIER